MLDKEKIALTDEEQETITGGGIVLDIWKTEMECQSVGCGYSECRRGKYLNLIFDCPKCKNHTLKGIRISIA